MFGAELTSPGTSCSPGTSGDAQHVELLVMSAAEPTSPGTTGSPGTSGDARRVELLVMSGADLALQNVVGNTALHVVVEESAREPAAEESFLEVCVVLVVGNDEIVR